MPEFTITHRGNDGYGRVGQFDVPNGPVETPALFPVINLIGGSTLDSGSAWRHFRDNLLNQDHLQGTMFQAMSFLEYGVSPKNLNWWREERLSDRFHRERHLKMKSPLFIDSGGFRLMNSDEFGQHPSEGGRSNKWQIYTSPDSILKLQADFGGNIIATLDYPILRDLSDEEKTERMERSINSAVRCLRLLQDPDIIEVTAGEIIQDADIQISPDSSSLSISESGGVLQLEAPPSAAFVEVEDSAGDEPDYEIDREQLSGRLHIESGQNQRFLDVVLLDAELDAVVTESVSIDKRELRSIAHIWDWKESGNEPAVYVAIHGHDYETINWYVANFLDRAREEGVESLFHGFAIGSLVPLRSETKVLVDVIQGAIDAIPESVRSDIALHVFGVGGKQASLLALLGVDTFDCSSHMQAASFKKYVVPGSWEHIVFDDIGEYLQDGEYPCDLEHCRLCQSAISPQEFIELINREPTYGVDGFTKGWLYALLARHNFEVYNEEVKNVREAIRNDQLLDYVIKFARDHNKIKSALKHAQVRDAELQHRLEQRQAYDLVAGPDISTDQSKLTEYGGGVSELDDSRTISLKYTPNSFNVLQRKYQPPEDTDILLLIPCSKEKPYSESRTHQAVMERLSPIQDRVHKVTISGLYGPVPTEFENEEPVLKYNYVLAQQDESQKEIVRKRVVQYLEQFGDKYATIVGYAASKNYRSILKDAFEEYDSGRLFPENPDVSLLREHFRRENINELLRHLGVEEINS